MNSSVTSTQVKEKNITMTSQELSPLCCMILPIITVSVSHRDKCYLDFITISLLFFIALQLVVLSLNKIVLPAFLLRIVNCTYSFVLLFLLNHYVYEIHMFRVL